MEWTGCGETPQTDEEELEGKIAATDLRESMEKSKEFWGDTQYDDKTVIPANLLKCPPCCDEHNMVAASQLAHIAWETMSQCDFEEMAKINRDLLSNGEIAANHLIPRIDSILKHAMDVNYMKVALEKVDIDYQQAVTLVANQLLFIFDENIPPRIEDDLETNVTKQTGGQVSPYSNNSGKSIPIHKDIKTRIKDLMQLALENGLGEIKVPKASYVNDRAKLAILEKQIKGRLRLKHIIESGASNNNNKSSPEDHNKSSYNQLKGHKILDLSKRLKSAKAMRDKIRSKGSGATAVGDQKVDEKIKLSMEKQLTKSPCFTSHSTNNVLTQAGSSKSDIVFSKSTANNDENIGEAKLISSSKVSNLEYLENVENKNLPYCCCNNETSSSVKNLSYNYKEENNNAQIVVETEVQSLSAKNSREPSANLSVPSSVSTNNFPLRELQDELDLINSCNTQDDNEITDISLKDLLKEKSFKDMRELSKENLYLKNMLQKRDLSLKVIREPNNDGDLKIKEKIIDFSPKAIIESISDISPLHEKQVHLTIKEKPTMIQSDSALKNLLENSKGDLLMKIVEERVNDSFRKDITNGSSSLMDAQNSKNDSTPAQISVQKNKEGNIENNSQGESSSVNLTKSRSDSLKNMQNLDYTLNETQNAIKNQGDSSMNVIYKNELNIDETKNKPLMNSNMNEIEKSKDLSLILRETMTQVHAKTNFIFTSPEPPYSRSFNLANNNITSNTNNNSSVQSKNNDAAESNNLQSNNNSQELKNVNANLAQNETEQYPWLPDLKINVRLQEANLGEMTELNDETVEEARGGDADGENDFEFDFDVDDIIERNKFLEIEEIRRHAANKSNNAENKIGLELELEKLTSEQKNINLCHDDGNVQIQMKNLMNDGQTCVDNNNEGCKYQQFSTVMDKVREMQQTEENIQDFEYRDSYTKLQEYMGEESLKENLVEITCGSEEVDNNNDEEIEDDEESVEDEDQEDEDEESEEDEEEDEEDEEEETESTMEEISSKSASIAVHSESMEINTDTAEQSSQSIVKEEVSNAEDIDAKGKKERTSRGGGDNSLLYITVFLGVFTATYFTDFGRHFFSKEVFTSLKSNAVNCLDRAIRAMTALKTRLQQS